MVVIVPYKFSWLDEFTVIGAEVRAALGKTALAVHHIGSTSVPGLAAKDVIDIQVTVAALDASLNHPLENAGFTFRDDIRRDHKPPGVTLLPEQLEKRYFQRLERPVHLHVRAAGRFNQRYALLCRDFLRAQPLARNAYAEVKKQLARYFPDNVEAYYDVKDPVFDVLMAGAFRVGRAYKLAAAALRTLSFTVSASALKFLVRPLRFGLCLSPSADTRRSSNGLKSLGSVRIRRCPTDLSVE